MTRIRYCEVDHPRGQDLCIGAFPGQRVQVLETRPIGPDIRYTYLLITEEQPFDESPRLPA